jgi:hypothetical protein
VSAASADPAARGRIDPAVREFIGRIPGKSNLSLGAS